MVTENNSQINTFIKGMNSDTSYSMIQEGLYTYANNLRIFQIDGNNQNSQGEVKIIEGIKIAKTELISDIDKILAVTSIRNIGIIIIKHKTGKWSVYRFNNAIGGVDHTSDNFGVISDMKCIFKCSEETTAESFSVVCRYEDKDNIKLYIADGKNPIMTLIFKEETEDVTVVERPINSISSNSTVTLFPPTVEEVIPGKLKSGMVSYAYRLYVKYGQSSEISPATRMYPTVNITNNGYKGANYEKNTNCGYRIKIDIPSTNNEIPDFDHVLIYRILYQVTGLLPTIELIGNVKIDNTRRYVYYNDEGNSALSTLTLEEFNASSGFHIVPLIIESKNDYMFASKITDNNQAYINEDIKNWDARSFSYDANGVCNLYNYEDLSIVKTFTSSEVDYNDIPATCDCFDINNIMLNSYDARYDANGNYGGTGRNISWQFLFKEVKLDENTDGRIGRIIKPKDSFNNPKIASEYKSLRRGELYRFGIILYTANGSHSDVKWIADIRTPEIYEEGFYPFVVHDYALYGRSLGIRFKVENLPDGVTGYEIVRCNRTQDDIKTLTQGVLSRPIQFHDATSLIADREGKTKPGQQSKIYPLMPTGYVSTAWWFTGASTAYRTQNTRSDLMYAYQNEPQYRTEVIDSMFPSCDNFENLDTYLFISAESTYLNDSTLSLIKNNVYLTPFRYLFPSLKGEMKTILSASLFHSRYWHYNSVPLGNNLNLPLYYRFQDDRFGSFPEQNVDINWLIADIYKCLYVFWDNATTGTNIYWDGKSSISLNVSGYDDPKYSYNPIDRDSVSSEGVVVNNWKDMLPYTCGYCKLYENSNNLISYNGSAITMSACDKLDINKVNKANEPKWNSIYTVGEGGKFVSSYENDIVNVGTSNYNNYVLGTLYGVDVNSDDFPMKGLNDNISNHGRDDTLTATGGRCYLIQIKNNKEYLNDINSIVGVANNEENIDYYKPIYKRNNDDCIAVPMFIGAHIYHYFIPHSIIGTCLCNIQHDIYPYRGGSLLSLETSSYYSYGDFFSADTQYATVFDGDCYPTILEYVSAHKVFGSERKEYQFCTTSIIYSIPLESNINTFLTNGFEFSDNTDIDTISCLQIEPSQVSSHLTQNEELYRYNSVYSSYSTHNPYVSESGEIKYNVNNDCRVYFSEIKSNNEEIDSWTKFKSSNYLDVDSRYGPITALKNFKNTLFFWQELATGRIASKERSVVTDINNMQLALGTGDILERYDYMDYIHGIHEGLHCIAESNDTLYWFDEQNQAIRATSDGNTVVDLTLQGSVNNYMRKYEQTNKNPKLFFDKKYNELICSVLDDKSIIYNQNLRAFTSFSDITFDESILFGNGTYLVKTVDDDLKVAQWNCRDNGSRDWNGSLLYTNLTYVVNKQPITTKVFDNQEIVTLNNPSTSASKYKNLKYSWTTDLNNSETDNLDITDREGNFRYAIPRADNANYGGRIRGKYMICEISGQSDYDTSIQYILTKFRTSWS